MIIRKKAARTEKWFLAFVKTTQGKEEVKKYEARLELVLEKFSRGIMRKIVVFNLVSLDGYFAGADGNIDWHMVDDEFNKFAIEQTSSFGTIIFGRVTYKIFEDFWPKAMNDSNMSPDDRKIGKIIDDVEKIVFSNSLKNVTWKNSKLFHEIDPKEIQKLKHGPHSAKGSRGVKKDMVIYGSGTIVQQLTNLGLIDEYRLLVNPIILGSGRLMFKDVNKRALKLIDMRVFKNGNVLLRYK